MVRNYKSTGNPRGRPRRRWTHYPSSFMQVIEHFLHSTNPLTIALPREELFTYRTQFYRFFNSIRDEYDTRTSDVDAAASGLTDAFNVANNVLVGTSEDLGLLTFRLGTLADTIISVTPERLLAAPTLPRQPNKFDERKIMIADKTEEPPQMMSKEELKEWKLRNKS